MQAGLSSEQYTYNTLPTVARLVLTFFCSYHGRGCTHPILGTQRLLWTLDNKRLDRRDMSYQPVG